MQLLGDFHVHSVASSHAYSTITEIARQAAHNGLEHVGITDHGPEMLDGPHPYYFSNLVVIPETIEGVRIQKGIEVNILDMNGRTDFDEVSFRKLDYAIASFHNVVSPENLNPQQVLAIYELVAVKPYIRVIGHPGNPKFPVPPNEFVELCRRFHVAVEINNSSFNHTRKGSLPRCLEIAKAAARQQADVLLSSDAHIHFDVGNVAQAYDVARQAGVLDDQIINFNREKIEFYFGGKT